MNREQFEKQLMICDDVWSVKEWSAPARELAKHDAEQRAEIERLTKERDEYRSLNEHHKEQFLKTNLELATAKGEVWTKADFQEWLRRQQKEQL